MHPPHPESDFQRTREDPISFLRVRALTLAPSLGVSLARMDEAVGVFVTAFGREWLTQASEDTAPSRPLAPCRHPLGDIVVLRLRRKVVDAHTNVAGILLVHRVWMPEIGRHGYLMHPLLRESDPSLPPVLVERLAALDRPSS